MPKDILLDDNFEPLFKDGDFVVDESTFQHQKILLYTEKGEFKSNPKTGVGSRKYLETSKTDEYAREIRLEFIADGMQVNSLKITENLEINIDAQYK